MKNLRLLFAIVLSISISMTFMACSSNSSSDQKTEKKEKDKSGPEYTSAYICPMHCEGSGGPEPGKCPVCTMDYRPNKDYVAPETEVEAREEKHFHTDPQEVPEEDRTESGE